MHRQCAAQALPGITQLLSHASMAGPHICSWHMQACMQYFSKSIMAAGSTESWLMLHAMTWLDFLCLHMAFEVKQELPHRQRLLLSGLCWAFCEQGSVLG